jgi:hypothetical protein
MRRAGPASAAALALWAVSNAGAEEQRVSVALATLNNGVSVGFALLRSGSQEAGESLGGVALGGAKAVSRVVVDREGGVFLG